MGAACQRQSWTLGKTHKDRVLERSRVGYFRNIFRGFFRNSDMTRAGLLALYLASFSLIGCGKIFQNTLAIEAEESCGFVQDSYGQRVSWKHAAPATLILSADWPQEFIPAAQSAAEAWNKIAGRTVVTISIDSVLLSPKASRDGLNGLYWLKEWSEDLRTIQAVTNLIFKNNLIIDADIKVNAKYFSFYLDTPNSAFQVHMESLLIHEIGHLLGLRHLTTTPTVMEPVLLPSILRNDISELDQKALLCEYST